MTRVKTATGGDLRAILCIAFTPGASLEQIRSFERFLIDRQEVVHAAEVEGSYDFLFEAAFPDLVRFHDFMEQVSQGFSTLLRKKKVSFICRRFIAGTDHSVWVHENGRRTRIDLDEVDEVIADGDYVRLRFAGRDYLHHATMQSIEAMLDPLRFLRIHRSVIVRLSRVERLLRDGRHWVVECRDGTRRRVAKGKVAELVDALAPFSSNAGHEPPVSGEHAGKPVLTIVE